MKTKLKALEPLIASILLIVVAVILVSFVLSWGKNFTNDSVSQTTGLINHEILSDKQPFMRFVEARNGMYTFDYYPPNTGNVNFKVVAYSLLGYNDYIPLEPEKEIIRAGKFMLPLGIVNEEAITISLLLEDGSYLTFKNIKNINLSPSQSDCPQGFVPVPGNHLYGTVYSKGGFCVAQFEMKVDQDGDGIGDSNTSCKSSSADTWVNKNDVNQCSYTLFERTIVSSAEGYPLTDINQTDSKLACQSIGGHLITNDEWMTLARNIEIVPDNWSSGTIGQGLLKRGNAGDVVVNVSYNGADPESGTGRNQLAMLKLTNGSEVWDLSGNVYDWVDKNIMRKDMPDAFNTADDTENNVGEIPTPYITSYSKDASYAAYLKYNDLGVTTMGYKDLYLLNSSYNTNQGIGVIYRLFSDRLSTNTDIRAVARGGNWSNGPHAGVLYLYLSNLPSLTYYYIGFRCAVVP